MKLEAWAIRYKKDGTIASLEMCNTASVMGWQARGSEALGDQVGKEGRTELRTRRTFLRLIEGLGWVCLAALLVVGRQEKASEQSSVNSKMTCRTLVFKEVLRGVLRTRPWIDRDQCSEMLRHSRDRISGRRCDRWFQAPLSCTPQ